MKKEAKKSFAKFVNSLFAFVQELMSHAPHCLDVDLVLLDDLALDSAAANKVRHAAAQRFGTLSQRKLLAVRHLNLNTVGARLFLVQAADIA